MIRIVLKVFWWSLYIFSTAVNRGERYFSLSLNPWKSQSLSHNWDQPSKSLNLKTETNKSDIQVNTTGHFWTKVKIKYIKKWDSSITRVWYSWIVWSYLSFSEKSTFYILSPNWLSASKWDQLSWWSFFSCSTFIWTLTDIYTRYGSTILLLLISTYFIIQPC